MTTLDAESRNLLSRIPFHDFEVVWAGSLPGHGGFCFGSDDGRIAITDKTGVTVQGGGRVSEEAINGVAVIRQCMAMSTRSEVGIQTLARTPEEQSLVKFPMGAHG